MAASVKGVERRFGGEKSKEEFVLGKSTLLKEIHTRRKTRKRKHAERGLRPRPSIDECFVRNMKRREVFST